MRAWVSIRDSGRDTRADEDFLWRNIEHTRVPSTGHSYAEDWFDFFRTDVSVLSFGAKPEAGERSWRVALVRRFQGRDGQSLMEEA
jgi:hypothetical protein